jgi:crossover junction endodeoxyribonuclease RusA
MAGVPRTELEVSGYSHPSTDAWVLHFTWPKNPLPMNGGRGSWRAHARKVREVKDQVRYRIRAARIPALGRCEASLTWWVIDNRTRDTDNLAQLEKPMFDALVLERVVADDKPALMTKPRGQIRHYHQGHGLVTAPGFTFHIHRLEIPGDDDFEIDR